MYMLFDDAYATPTPNQVIFIETIIAMNFFGGKLGDQVGDLVDTHGIRYHFDYFSVAFASTWMCITTEAQP